MDQNNNGEIRGEVRHPPHVFFERIPGLVGCAWPSEMSSARRASQEVRVVFDPGNHAGFDER